MGPFGLRVRLDDLWSSPSRFVVAGHTLMAPPPEVRFLHACFHAVLGDRFPRLTTLPRRGPAGAPPAARRRPGPAAERRLGRRRGGGRRGRAGERRARARTGGHPARLGRLLRPTDQDRRDLAVYATSDGDLRRQSSRALRAIPGNRGTGRVPGRPRRLLRAGSSGNSGTRDAWRRWHRGASASRPFAAGARGNSPTVTGDFLRPHVERTTWRLYPLPGCPVTRVADHP